MTNRWGNNGNGDNFILGGSKITADGDCSHEIKRHLLIGRKAMTNLDSVLKNRDITLLTKVCTVKAMVFSSSHVWMWELNHKDWAPKNWYFWTMVLEKTLESSLDSKEIKSVNHKGNQPWILIGRTDAPMFWSPDAKSQLTGKDPDAVEDWGQEKRSTEDKMVRQHHQLNEHEFEQTLGNNRQGSLVCCSPWGCRVGHDLATEQQPGITVGQKPNCY